LIYGQQKMESRPWGGVLAYCQNSKYKILAAGVCPALNPG
jgi:hypothetical protein